MIFNFTKKGKFELHQVMCSNFGNIVVYIDKYGPFLPLGWSRSATNWKDGGLRQFQSAKVSSGKMLNPQVVV